MPVKLTDSMKHYLWIYHREQIPLIMMGHLELVMEWWDDYISWLKTDEGKQYLNKEN